MEKSEFVLAVLSTSSGKSFSPVQVQKLFFLIDMRIPKSVKGPYFNFVPYDYGPFDPEVYRVLEELERTGDVKINKEFGNYRNYSLSLQGQKKGEDAIKYFEKNIQEYIKTLSEFVRDLSFIELVFAIYKAYPEMKVNSVFKEP
jgi:hypothetical protein